MSITKLNLLLKSGFVQKFQIPKSQCKCHDIVYHKLIDLTSINVGELPATGNFTDHELPYTQKSKLTRSCHKQAIECNIKIMAKLVQLFLALKTKTD